MKPNKTKNERQNQAEQAPDLHGAAIINERGQEVPITEKMIQRAFRKLIDAWTVEHKALKRKHC